MYKNFWWRHMKRKGHLENRGREWKCNNKIVKKITLRPDLINLAKRGKVS